MLYVFLFDHEDFRQPGLKKQKKKKTQCVKGGADFELCHFFCQEILTTWTRNFTGNPPSVSLSVLGSLFVHGEAFMRGSLSCFLKADFFFMFRSFEIALLYNDALWFID